MKGTQNLGQTMLPPTEPSRPPLFVLACAPSGNKIHDLEWPYDILFVTVHLVFEGWPDKTARTAPGIVL